MFLGPGGRFNPVVLRLHNDAFFIPDMESHKRGLDFIKIQVLPRRILIVTFRTNWDKHSKDDSTHEDLGMFHENPMFTCTFTTLQQPKCPKKGYL